MKIAAGCDEGVDSLDAQEATVTSKSRTLLAGERDALGEENCVKPGGGEEVVLRKSGLREPLIFASAAKRATRSSNRTSDAPEASSAPRNSGASRGYLLGLSTTPCPGTPETPGTPVARRDLGVEVEEEHAEVLEFVLEIWTKCSRSWRTLRLLSYAESAADCSSFAVGVLSRCRVLSVLASCNDCTRTPPIPFRWRRTTCSAEEVDR